MASKKIILIQLFSNGDCLFATTIARQIKHDYPGCHLTWAVAPFSKGAILENPYIDEIWEVSYVNKKDIVALRKFRAEVLKKKMEGQYDEIFFSMAADENQAYYDGSIRSNILSSYPGKITESVKPVLRFSDAEKIKVDAWANSKNLLNYKHVILFEFAAQSGQVNITTEEAIQIAEVLAAIDGVAVILSSAIKVVSNNPAVIDGSELSYRESVYLSNHCSLLLGCSSGITWGTISDGGKQLPMVQILDPWAIWVNPISRDFERYGIDTGKLIELVSFDKNKVIECIKSIHSNGFDSTRVAYNQQIPLHFYTSRKIVYNLLCYLQFGAIIKHIKVNVKTYGWNSSFFKQVILAVLTAPFTLAKNIFNKKVLGHR
jgi:hypothetical protein